ncbi:hypothetical protein [Saccharopolyspora spinosa]|uniref:hypothetical protein n=1 Tax=Saccharopolyspora spinosa TaxID=60894 RepID=UPI00376ED8CF
MTSMPHSHGQGASIADYSIIEAGFVTVDLNLRRRLLHSAVDTAVLTEVFLRVRLADGTVGWAETRGNGAYATKHDTTDIVAALMAIPDLPWSNPGSLLIAWLDHAHLRRCWWTLRGETRSPDRQASRCGAR